MRISVDASRKNSRGGRLEDDGARVLVGRASPLASMSLRAERSNLFTTETASSQRRKLLISLRLRFSCLRTTILQNVVSRARFSKLPNTSDGNPRSYVSRKAAKIAKVNSMAILSSWREHWFWLRPKAALGPPCLRGEPLRPERFTNDDRRLIHPQTHLPLRKQGSNANFRRFQTGHAAPGRSTIRISTCFSAPHPLQRFHAPTLPRGPWPHFLSLLPCLLRRALPYYHYFH